MQEQIIENGKARDDDVGDIYKEEIEELKQNLEQKEYSLQLTEQRAAAFERLLYQLAGQNTEVQQALEDQNILVRDRKIGNVVSENVFLQQDVQELRHENGQLREVLEKVRGGVKVDPAFVEEISIFQNKGQYSKKKPESQYDFTRPTQGTLGESEVDQKAAV